MDHITEINDKLTELEEKQEDENVVFSLFRSFHSIKGMAASMNYDNIRDVSHKLEDLLDGLRSGKVSYSKEIANLLYDGAAIIERMVRAIEDNLEDQPNTTNFLNTLNLMLIQKEMPQQTSPAPPVKEEPILKELSHEELKEISNYIDRKYKISVVISDDSISPPARAYLLIEMIKEKAQILATVPSMEDIENDRFERECDIFVISELSSDELEALVASSVEIEKFSVSEITVNEAERTNDDRQLFTREKSEPKEEEEPIRYRKPGAVKVDTPVLDGLINIVGEMFIQQNQLVELFNSVKMSKAVEGVNSFEKLVRKLYKEVMTLRLIPMAMLADMIPRVIRDITRDSGKKVELDIHGREIKVDRSIVEKLGDPFIHLIRNCIDHGIELPEERLKSGKPEIATITFVAGKEKDAINISVSDDGRGLNEQRIKEKALENGLVEPEELAKMSTEEIYNFIWHNGFSTSGEITSVSGRGVGMDIIKNVVDELGGKIRLESTPGGGTTFHFYIPLSLAIIRTFRIRLEKDIFAIPFSRIVRTIEIPSDELYNDTEGLYFIYREEEIRVRDLKKILKYTTNGLSGKAGIPILVIESNQNKYGLIVDAFLSGYETVVKPLGRPLDRLEFLSGATMSEKGELILILDVDKLLSY